MPDIVQLSIALAAAVLSAAAVVFLCRMARKSLVEGPAGAVLGLAVGFFAGCAVLGLRPHWPPREDQDRLLLIVMPTVVIVELLQGVVGKWIWALRAVAVAGTAWALLFGSVYLEDLAGPGSREWTVAQAFLILGALAVVLAAVWGSLTLVAQRPGGKTVPMALGLTCGGAALTIMLSGYASGGQLGLPFAGALVGVLIASLFIGSVDVTGVTGVAVVGLFALLVIGRFFGELSTNNAVALFLTPLLCWLFELPGVRKLGPRLRGVARLALTAVPLVVVLFLAKEKFLAESARPATGTTQEGSVEDYMSFGK